MAIGVEAEPPIVQFQAKPGIECEKEGLRSNSPAIFKYQKYASARLNREILYSSGGGTSHSEDENARLTNVNETGPELRSNSETIAVSQLWRSHLRLDTRIGCTINRLLSVIKVGL